MKGQLLSAAVIAAGGLTCIADGAELLVPQQYPTIQAGIDAAEPGDVVIVADGTYRGHGNRDITFDGKAITVRSAGGPTVCIIDCAGTQQNPHRGFYFGSGETNASVVEGFTICNGSTPPGAVLDEFNGAGIMINNGSSPTIRNCIIRNNWAGCWGGAISCGWVAEAQPVIDRCVIVNNFAGDEGGGLFAVGANPTVINTVIANNEAGTAGGGILSLGGGSFTIRNSTIILNSAPWAGGVYDWNGTVTNSIIRGNNGDGQAFNTLGSVTYSNIEGGFDGVGNVDVDPMLLNPARGDVHLLPGSPMIDAGDPSFVPAQGELDMDGNSRLVGLGVDMGADELLLIGDINEDGV
ncbi:MAG: right-handed parallel beta-helix repeat-containing protein, partial [Planctomycetota bacterium]|nr:right-handed parallel beta-helix repeat-containing protein [Planctomycetota bacterium]